MSGLRTLGEIAELRTGLQSSWLNKEVSGKRVNSSKRGSDEHPHEVRLLSLSSITGEPRAVDLSSLPKGLFVAAKTAERFRVTDEDLLVQPKGGDYWAVQPGEVELDEGMGDGEEEDKEEDGIKLELVFSYQLIRVRPHEGVLPGYLMWYLNHRETAELLRVLEQGTTVPFLSKQNLERLRVPLPPVEIQEALIAVSAAHEDEEAVTRQLLSQRRAQLESEGLQQVLRASGVKPEALNE
jgi:hypothetical protein